MWKTTKYTCHHIIKNERKKIIAIYQWKREKKMPINKITSKLSETQKCSELTFSIQIIKGEIVFIKGCEWMYLLVEAKAWTIKVIKRWEMVSVTSNYHVFGLVKLSLSI